VIDRFAVVTPDQVPELLRDTTRKLTRLFWHCSASDRPEHDSARVMHAWHLDRKFRQIGYHLFIRKDGIAELGRPWSETPAAQSGHNTGSLAFCLHGLKIEAFTRAQELAMLTWTRAVVDQRPGLTVHGHCEVANKSCPVIDYRAVLGLDGAGRMAREPARGRQDPILLSDADGLLRLGDRGPAVEVLQGLLNARGESLTLDGIFGRATDAAVRRFQSRYELRPDGIVGTKTRAALRRVMLAA
jgi:hypothetical protein